MTCTGKTGYESRYRAWAALDMIAKHPLPNQPTPRIAYECERCGQWHLSSHLRAVVIENGRPVVVAL